MERESLLILDKGFDKLMADSLQELAQTEITNVGPGGVARLLLSIVNKPIADFYKTLKLEHTKAFLSKATNNILDLIGELLNCERYPDEADEDYRYRISRQTLTLERANETAVRLAVLSVPGVVDVITKEFTHGTGSFSVYPIMDDPLAWDEAMTTRIYVSLKDVRAYGVRALVLQPRLAEVELKGRLVFDQQVADMDRILLQTEAIQNVRTYINSRKPGEKLEMRVIKNLVLNVSARIIDVDIYYFTINNKAMLPVDQELPWNERFIEALGTKKIVFS